MMTHGDGTSGFKPAGERFATGFAKTTGDVFVFGALFLAALAVGFGVYFRTDGFFVGALVCLISAFYFYPYADVKHVQLGADARGLYVGGLGLIDWKAVENVELIRVAVRRVERAELSVVLNKPLEQALLVADETPWWRALMVHNWSDRGDGRVVVRLEQLKASPDQIESDLMPFWERQ